MVDGTNVRDALLLAQEHILLARRLELGLPLEQQAVRLGVERAEELSNGRLEHGDAGGARRFRLGDGRLAQVGEEPLELSAHDAAHEQRERSLGGLATNQGDVVLERHRR